MGAYIPGMEEHNAVNNDDGFTTGFLGHHESNNVNVVPPQGYMQDPMQPPIQNTQQVPMQNTQQMPLQNTQQVPMQNTQQMPMQNNNPKPEPKMPSKKKEFKLPNINNIGKGTGAELVEKKTNKIGKILNMISIGIIVILIIFLILYSMGVFKKDNKNNIQQQEEPVVDIEKENREKMFNQLNSSCSNLDAEGNFGVDQDPVEGCDTLTCNILNNVVCTNSFCLVSDGKTVYSKNCTTGDTRTAEVNAFQAAVNLGEACDTLLTSPSLNGKLEASFATCDNYICKTEVNSKTYDKNCNENS